MKATIRIVNAHFYSYIGALPEEQVLGNRYIVNLTATYDATKAVASDDVADAVSYADHSDRADGHRHLYVAQEWRGDLSLFCLWGGPKETFALGRNHRFYLCSV